MDPCARIHVLILPSPQAARPPPMTRRVAITGLGCVCPLGSDIEAIWRRLLDGASGVGRITLFDASGFPVQIAAEVPGWDVRRVPGGDPDELSQHARQTQFAVAAAHAAWQDSGLADRQLDPQRIGVYLGCGEVFPDLSSIGQLVAGALAGENLDLRTFLANAAVQLGGEEPYYEPGAACALIARQFDAQGPVTNYTAACVSSSLAVGEAAEAIRSGLADTVLAGGAHSMIHPLGITGFHRLATLSTRNAEPERAARPFDNERDGFVVGEGAAIAILEDWDHARRRGARVLAEVSGFASTHDAYRITDPRPDARSSALCITQALARAGRDAADVGYINAHGSGTIANDRLETQAIKKAFGKYAFSVPVSSTKSMTGHLTTACGALEFVICVLALRDQIAPPTINYETPDPLCDLDYVPNRSRPMSCQHVLSNSFGFGGQNACLVVSRVV